MLLWGIAMANNWKPRTMPFGRYKGLLLLALPTDYLTWLTSLPDLREPLRSAVVAEGRRRSGTRDPDPPPLGGPIDGDLAAALVEAGRRALAVKHHPDRGGETALMARVNDTADRLLARFPRRRRVA